MDATRSRKRTENRNEVKAGGSISAEFDYFPDHYINQAKEPEEHVQAF